MWKQYATLCWASVQEVDLVDVYNTSMHLALDNHAWSCASLRSLDWLHSSTCSRVSIARQKKNTKKKHHNAAKLSYGVTDDLFGGKKTNHSCLSIFLLLTFQTLLPAPCTTKLLIFAEKSMLVLYLWPTTLPTVPYSILCFLSLKIVYTNWSHSLSLKAVFLIVFQSRS